MTNLPLILPPPLRTGAHIRVIAPSGPVPREALESGLSIVRDTFGFEVSVDKNVFSNDRYFAGPDTQRIDALHDALDDPAVDGIWCARGGYGAIRIAAQIDTEKTRRRPVPFIGFSDITVLHQVFNKAGVATFHGPVITQLPRLDETSIERARQILTGDMEASCWRLPNAEVLNAGSATGPLMGGNLAILASLVGTPWQPDFTDAVVFLEDVGEACYRCDRLIQQLFHSSSLQNAAAIVLGDFTKFPAGEEPWFDALWKEVADRIQGPLMRGVPIGHGERNGVIPLGIQCRIETDSPALYLEEAWVKKP